MKKLQSEEIDELIEFLGKKGINAENWCDGLIRQKAQIIISEEKFRKARLAIKDKNIEERPELIEV